MTKLHWSTAPSGDRDGAAAGPWGGLSSPLAPPQAGEVKRGAVQSHFRRHLTQSAQWQAAESGSGSLAPHVCGQEFHAVILGWTSFSYVWREDRERLLKALRTLAPRAPLLLSYLGEGETFEERLATVRRGYRRLLRFCGARALAQPSDRFQPWMGFFQTLTPEEVHARVGWTGPDLCDTSYQKLWRTKSHCEKFNLTPATEGCWMSKRRPKGRANRTAIGTKGPAVRSPSSPPAQKPLPGPPLPIARCVFSGRALWVSLALIAANFIVYAQVWHHDFVNFDDQSYVTDNLVVTRGLTWKGVRWAFRTGHAANWHPLTWLSHMLDVQLYGLHPGPHHLTNVLLHIANTLLLFGLLHRMTQALGRSAFVAGLFAVHPLHVESVAWVAERKDVLSTLFGLLTLCAYVAYARQPGRRRYCLVLVLFVAGLMAKPMLVTLPLVLLLLDFWPLRRVAIGANPADSSEPRRDWRSDVVRLVLEKLSLLGLSAVSSIVTFVAQRQGGAVMGLEKLPLKLRAANALVSYIAYIDKMLWPVRLAVFYPYSSVPSDWWVAGAALGLLGVSIAVLRAGLRHPYLPVGWFWYLGTMVPVIGLVQVGSQTMADRYTYVPLIGLFIIVAWGVPELAARWAHRGVILPAAALGAILACMFSAWRQVHYWQNSTALWTHALEVTSGNNIAHSNLGDALRNLGKYDEAIAQYSEALRIKPDFPEAHNSLGVALASRGRLREAVAQYSASLRFKPDAPLTHSNLGNALRDLGKYDEAIAQYSEALRLKPDYPEAHYNLGVALANLGRFEEAAAQFSEALRTKPDFPEAHNNLGVVLARRGRLDEAIAQYSSALSLKPDYPEAHNNLGAALADRGRFDEAMAQYSEAVRIKPDYPEAYFNLGNALRSRGRFNEAVVQFSEALRLKPDYPEARRALDDLARRAKHPNPAMRDPANR